jgi:hypothetical protein
VVLGQAILGDQVLAEFPFEVTAGGPPGDVPFIDLVARMEESRDNVLVWDAVG